MLSRRGFLIAAGGLPLAAALRETGATPQEMQAAMRAVTRGAAVRAGRVKVEMPPLVENGHSVPLAVSVESPMTAADHVRAIHVFTEKNPLPNVVSVYLGPRAGRPRIATRIRVADTQTVTALAEMSDGTFWSGSVHVVVTLSACLEEGLI